MRKKIKIIWSCSDYVHHEHSYRLIAMLCGKLQYFKVIMQNWVFNKHIKDPKIFNEKVHAELLPLNGKYYGTIIKVTNTDGSIYKLSVWNPYDTERFDLEPSSRELQAYSDDAYEITIHDWRENKIVYCPRYFFNVYGKNLPKNCNFKEYAREIVELCDGHFEDSETYKFAQQIVNIINNGVVHISYFPNKILYKTLKYVCM